MDGLNVDVLVDEFDGLSTEGVPDELAGASGGLDRVVDLDQPAVVGLVRIQHRVRGDGLPKVAQIADGGGEGVTKV